MSINAEMLAALKALINCPDYRGISTLEMLAARKAVSHATKGKSCCPSESQYLAGTEYALEALLDAFRDRAQTSSELIAISCGDAALKKVKDMRREDR